MEKLTITDILQLYERYRAMVQMKPSSPNLKVFANYVKKYPTEGAYLTQDAIDTWFMRHDGKFRGFGPLVTAKSVR